jgi:hypothetical protein
MGERSERPAELVRLVLEFGESVEVDGSTVFDPVADERVPAVVLRMPRGRAAWFGRVLEAYTRVCRLASAELDAAESAPAWALARAAAAAGHVEPAGRPSGRVTSGRRMSAAAVLREVEDFDDSTLIAVVDAAARWLEEPSGDEYAWALLGAVTDAATQQRAYGELLGAGGGVR